MIEFKYLFRAILILYTSGWLLAAVDYLLPRKWIETTVKWLFIFSLPVHVAGIFARGSDVGYEPLFSIPDVFLLLSLATILLYYFLNLRLKNGILGIVFPPFSIFLLHLFLFINQQTIEGFSLQELNPVLTKTILFTHIISLLIGYLLFCAATVISLLFIYQEQKIKNKQLLLSDDKLPSLGWLDRFNYRSVAFGFLFMTVGILLGMSASSHTPPFETAKIIRFMLPIITWLVYGAFLLDRSIKGIRGKITAIWSILGFSMAIITLIHEVIYVMNK